jgi:hypothetical protein
MVGISEEAELLHESAVLVRKLGLVSTWINYGI